MCGASTALGSPSNGLLSGNGSSAKTSRARAAEVAAGQRLDQFALIYQFAARGVHQHRALLHHEGIDAGARFVGQRHVQRDDVAGREQVAERQIFIRHVAFASRIVDDLRAERGQRGREQLGRIAESDEADGAPADLAYLIEFGRVGGPASPARVRASKKQVRRSTAIISDSAISATAWLLVPGMLHTAAP